MTHVRQQATMSQCQITSQQELAMIPLLGCSLANIPLLPRSLLPCSREGIWGGDWGDCKNLPHIRLELWLLRVVRYKGNCIKFNRKLQYISNVHTCSVIFIFASAPMDPFQINTERILWLAHWRPEIYPACFLRCVLLGVSLKWLCVSSLQFLQDLGAAACSRPVFSSRRGCSGQMAPLVTKTSIYSPSLRPLLPPLPRFQIQNAVMYRANILLYPNTSTLLMLSDQNFSLLTAKVM